MKRYRNTEYYVTEDGDVWSDHNNPMGHRWLKQCVKNGYKYVSVTVDGVKKYYKVNRMVAECYVPNPDNLPLVNHKDGKKLNNRYTNLEWSTHSGNTQHAHDNGLMTNTKNILGINIVSGLILTYKSMSEAQRITGIKNQTISKCCAGVLHQSGGHIWMKY